MTAHGGSSFDMSEPAPSDEEMQQMMVEKAHELFKVCDTEVKGFITKRDMQRLQNELPLSPEQLEHVFDSLDDDGNGFLTLEEFTDGFGSFLGIKSSTSAEDPGSMNASGIYVEGHIDPVEEAQNFKHMMDNLGATDLFEDETTVQALWCRLRREDPDLASNFEDFVFRVSSEIRKSKADFDTLEGALRSKTSAHDEEVRKLYEEMEVQIKQEKERIRNEERAKERQLREAMENEMMEKDKQLQELLNKHAEMEEKLGYLNTVEAETKIENEKLAKEKEDMEEMLIQSQRSLEESQAYINQLRQQQKEEKRERAKAAIKLTEGIVVERETLVKQLDMLKSVNRKLQDEMDEADIRRDNSFQNSSVEQEMETPSQESPRRGELERQGSTLDKYFHPQRIPKLPSCAESINEDVEREVNGHIHDIDDGIECDDDAYIHGQTPEFIHHTLNTYHNKGRSSNIGSSSVSRPVHSSPRQHREAILTDPLTVDFDDCSSSSGRVSPASPREQPVGADELTDSGIQTETDATQLQRVFKVVFVGDSGVGKSSFIHRFCTSHFKASYSATIGVDFQIKNLRIEGQSIVLQLWDTAGQERFRSITKQYFRKADGVVVMYDVTSETSFVNVRNWMTSVQEGASEDAVIVLLGNKNDLPEDDDKKAVLMKNGSRLADEYGTLFYETSAFSGENVSNAMEALARVLKDKEDKQIEKSFRLDEPQKKNSCCSRSS